MTGGELGGSSRVHAGKWGMPELRVDPGGAELELEVGKEPSAQVDAVVVATLGGEWRE